MNVFKWSTTGRMKFASLSDRCIFTRQQSKINKYLLFFLSCFFFFFLNGKSVYHGNFEKKMFNEMPLGKPYITLYQHISIHAKIVVQCEMYVCRTISRTPLYIPYLPQHIVCATAHNFRPCGARIYTVVLLYVHYDLHGYSLHFVYNTIHCTTAMYSFP